MEFDQIYAPIKPIKYQGRNNFNWIPRKNIEKIMPVRQKQLTQKAQLSFLFNPDDCVQFVHSEQFKYNLTTF